MNATSTVTRPKPPLGLPKGSVRALLTLLIVSVVCHELYSGRSVGVFWSETLMIALAHYFTSRRFVDLPQDVIKRLEAEGHLPRESSPLYLPRNSIRLIITAAFVGLGIQLYRKWQTIPAVALPVLGVVFAYSIGLLTGRIWKRLFRSKPNSKISVWWNNAKALLVLAALTVTAVAHLTQQADLIPEQFTNITLGLVLFYFGSR